MSTTANRGPGVLSRFAHLVGAGKAKAKAEDVPTGEEHDELEDKVETVEDKVEDLEDRIEDVEEEVEDDPDMPAEDKPEARKAYQKGKANGRKAEKARAGAIMGLKASASNLPLALHLAFDTGTSPKAALATLQAAQAGAPAPATATPAKKHGGNLDRRMDQTPPVAVGNGSADAGKLDPNTPEGAAAFVLATHDLVRGTKRKEA